MCGKEIDAINRKLNKIEEILKRLEERITLLEQNLILPLHPRHEGKLISIKWI